MRHFSETEKQRAIELYFTEDLTTQEVVDRLGYPTRQNLERWLRQDERYAERIAHNFYPTALKIKAVEMYQSKEYSVSEIAASLNLPSAGVVYYWMHKVREYGYEASRSLFVGKVRMTIERVWDTLPNYYNFSSAPPYHRKKIKGQQIRFFNLSSIFLVYTYRERRR